jgi:hypothetical protein
MITSETIHIIEQNCKIPGTPRQTLSTMNFNNLCFSAVPWQGPCLYSCVNRGQAMVTNGQKEEGGSSDGKD